MSPMIWKSLLEDVRNKEQFLNRIMNLPRAESYVRGI